MGLYEKNPQLVNDDYRTAVGLTPTKIGPHFVIGNWGGDNAAPYLVLESNLNNAEQQGPSILFTNAAMQGEDHRLGQIQCFTDQSINSGKCFLEASPGYIGPVMALGWNGNHEVAVGREPGTGWAFMIRAQPDQNAFSIENSAGTTLFKMVGNDIILTQPGAGVVLKSPDGRTCRKLTIDNSGALALLAMDCP